MTFELTFILAVNLLYSIQSLNCLIEPHQIVFPVEKNFNRVERDRLANTYDIFRLKRHLTQPGIPLIEPLDSQKNKIADLPQQRRLTKGRLSLDGYAYDNEEQSTQETSSVQTEINASATSSAETTTANAESASDGKEEIISPIIMYAIIVGVILMIIVLLVLVIVIVYIILTIPSNDTEEEEDSCAMPKDFC